MAHRSPRGRPAVRVRGPYSRRPKNSIEQPSISALSLHHKIYHAYLIDYPVAIILMVAPFRLNLSKSSPVALWLSAVPRITALLLPAFTDHATGLLRVIRYWPHLWVDRALGVDSITAPSAFHFTGLDAWYYWVLAAGVLLSTSVFNAPEEPVATRSGLDMRAAG